MRQCCDWLFYFSESESMQELSPRKLPQTSKTAVIGRSVFHLVKNVMRFMYHRVTFIKLHRN
jgi:hypothetical protein